MGRWHWPLKNTPKGSRSDTENPDKSQDSETGGGNDGVGSQNTAKLTAICGGDVELAELVAMWPELSQDVRVAVMRLIRSA